MLSVRALLVLLALFCGWGCCKGRHFVSPPANLRSALYPEWAHHHWVWLSADRANQSSMLAYAQEYLDHGIKVGAVDIDSGWSTGFNDFVFDTKKYPNATAMVDTFYSKGVRVILWATSMIDTDSSNYQEASSRGYLIRDIIGHEALFSWWHGKGGLLDYSNPEAKEWWHGQMDKALSLGIDGWKCDGTDPYILELVVPVGKGGVITYRDYADAYYGDFFDYTREKLGADRLIMSRPTDGFGPIFLEFSPKRVMFSGWVGDDDPTFGGLESALKSYLHSAWDGYANFGSDIGGYRSGSGALGRTKELFVRWAQLGAFSPLMENGGDKEHRPWKFDTTNETLMIYQKFVDVHYQLIPYLLTTGSAAFENNRSSITPLAKHDSIIEKIIADFNPDTYNYLLGKDILVAPLLSNTSQVHVTFPAGSSSWVYWWDHSKVYSAGSQHTFLSVPLEEFPVFFRNGTFIPLRVTDDTPTLGGGFADYIRWLIHSPAPSAVQNSLTSEVREFSGPGITATQWWPTDSCLAVAISAHPTTSSIIEVGGLTAPPRAVTAGAGCCSAGGGVALPPVLSHAELSERGRGYVVSHRDECYDVVLHPGDSPELGHVVCIEY